MQGGFYPIAAAADQLRDVPVRVTQQPPATRWRGCRAAGGRRSPVGKPPFTRTGLPPLLLYRGLSVVGGEAGLGIGFEAVEMTQVVGLVLLGTALAEAA